MDTMQESASKIESAVVGMIERHDKAVSRFWGVLITIILSGAVGIGGVYVFSVSRSDAAMAKAEDVEKGAATVVFHDADMVEAKVHHDELAAKDFAFQEYQQDLILYEIDQLKPRNKRTRERPNP